MAEVKTYLLAWDFDKFRDQIKDSQGLYTQLGASLRDLVASVSTGLGDLQQRAASVSTTLGTVTPQIERSVQSMKEGSVSANQLMESIARSGSRIAADLSRATAGGPGGGRGGGATSPAVEKAGEEVEAVKASAMAALDMANSAMSQVDDALKTIERNKRALKKDMTMAERYMKEELKNAAARVKEVASNMPGGLSILPGGILGGLLGAMILGYTEKNRIEAQSGEVLNVFEATGEALRSKAGEKARSFFVGREGFVERAQWFYGISKEESEGVLKAMVDAGYKGKEISASVNKSLGEVGENVAVMSMAIDKHLNQDTGTSIRNIIQISASLGDSLKQSTDKYLRLAFAAQRSGMGIDKFINTVISGASAMQQYGIDVRDVANMMVTVKKHYQDMGLDPQYAGERAAQAVEGLLTGMANMNPGMKGIIMQRLNPGVYGGANADAPQAFEDGFRRVVSGEDKKFASRAAMALYQYAAEGRDRTAAIQILMANAGLSNQSAAALVDTKGEIAKLNALTGLNTKEMENLKNSFITEGERLSNLHKMQRELYVAVGDIGRGLLKVLTGLVGVLALGFKSIPVLVMAIIPGSTVGWEDIDRISRKFDDLKVGISDGLGLVAGGIGQLPEIFGKEFQDDLKPIMDALKYEPPKYAPGGVEMPSPFESIEENLRRVEAIKDEMIRDATELISDADTREMVLSAMKSGLVTARGLSSYIKQREDEKAKKRYEAAADKITGKRKDEELPLKSREIRDATEAALAASGLGGKVVMTAKQAGTQAQIAQKNTMSHPNSPQ